MYSELSTCWKPFDLCIKYRYLRICTYLVNHEVHMLVWRTKRTKLVWNRQKGKSKAIGDVHSATEDKMTGLETNREPRNDICEISKMVGRR